MSVEPTKVEIVSGNGVGVIALVLLFIIAMNACEINYNVSKIRRHIVQVEEVTP